MNWKKDQKPSHKSFLDVAVVGAVAPVTEVAVGEFVTEQGNHPVLRFPFWFADGAHGMLLSCS